MPNVRMDDETYRRLRLIAATLGVDEGQAVAELIKRLEGAQPKTGDDTVPVHFDYRHSHTEGVYHRRTKALTITTGPHAGTSYPKPSPAAVAVVSDVAPGVDPNRNGWDVWTVTATNEPLQTIRHT